MTRTQYDAASPGAIPRLPSYQNILVAAYLTGTPGQNWQGFLSRFPGATMVTIDQHGFGSHDYKANVMDVEPECWSVSDIPNWTRMCEAPRPTVYCDRNDYPAVRDTWKGDIWLAAPGGVNLADYPGVVAVQEEFRGDYDVSVVYDKYWPLLPPPVSQGLTITTDDKGHLSMTWTSATGSAGYEILITGTGGEGTGTSYIHDMVSSSTITVTEALAQGSYNVTVTPVYPEAVKMTDQFIVKG